jgi:hypothetical protein
VSRTATATPTAQRARAGVAGAASQLLAGSPRREAIVDKNHRSLSDGGRRSVSPISAFAARELGLLSGRHVAYPIRRYRQKVDQLLVQHANSTARMAPMAKLWLAGHAELAYEEDVEGRIDAHGYLEGHPYSATP